MVRTFAPLAWASLVSLSRAIPVDLEPRNPQADIFPQGPSIAVVLDLPTASPLPPPGSTGSFYGGEDLLGPNGNPVKGSSIVKDYQLVPGQQDDPDLGIALDFSQIDAPQPIRGNTGMSGGTDPGPPGERND
jgi:hypothetical protein